MMLANQQLSYGDILAAAIQYLLPFHKRNWWDFVEQFGDVDSNILWHAWKDAQFLLFS